MSVSQHESGFADLARADVRANAGDPRSIFILSFFRLASAARGSGPRARPVSLPLLIAYKLIVEWVMNVELPLTLRVGPGLRLFHSHGLVVHPRTVIGRDVVLKHGVTLGHRGEEGETDPVPTIGDRVVFGPHSQVLGGVSVGEGARIGAGAVVLEDVPPHAVAVGVPARISRRS